jgi:hypothetical protein
MEMLLGIFSAFGLSASAGLNAYIPLLVVGVLDHYTDLIKLQAPWNTLSNPWILILLGILLIIEMLADKIPVANHINDLIQTFVRPVAGAIAFAASANVISGIHPVVALACGLLVAGTVHVAKSAAIRPAVTAVSGGTANVPVSVAEDITSTVVSLIAVVAPVIMATLLVLGLALIGWWLWRRGETTRA